MAEPRFAFGASWRRYLDDIDARRIQSAEQSLRNVLDMPELRGQRFLDMGCGSGLFSLAARRLGASVVSFDSDPESVACAEELKRRFAPGDPGWHIEQGSVLDADYLRGLGQFDIVYSWGVLHHTGAMWRALELAALPVAPGGRLYIAVYNDQGWLSRYWLRVRKIYNANVLGRFLMIALHAPYLYFLRGFWRAITGRGRVSRGMSLWHDMCDWLGGLPFEVATPGKIVEFYAMRGFDSVIVKTVGRRHGCNEFVFRRR